MAGQLTTRSKPDLPFKVRLLNAACSFALNASRRSNYTVNRRLMQFIDPKTPAPSTKLINGIPVTSSDVSVDPARHDVWFRLFVPSFTTNIIDDSDSDSDSSPKKKLPLIIYIHGGGFTFFSAGTKPFDDFCRRVAGEIPAIVASVNYRLAPEHRFPSQYDDVYDVLKFIDSQNYAVLPSNTDLTCCFISGDSAGGNIGHHVALRACRNSEDFKTLKIVGLVLVQPFFGGEERTEPELRLTRVTFVNVEFTDWIWRAFLPEGEDRNHEAVNVSGGGSDPETEEILRGKFPATVVIVGGFDPLQEWQRRYYEWLKKRCGGKEVELIEYPNGIHAFYTFPDLPESDFFIRDLRNFVEKQKQSSSSK